MKTKHWLIAAAAVAVGGVLVYSRLTAGAPPLPKVPLTAEVAHTEVPQLPLPPVVLPPDEPLVMPPVPVTEAAAVPLPTQKLDAGATSPVTLASATEPVIPPVPAVPPGPVPAAPPVPSAPPIPTPGPVAPSEGPLAPPVPVAPVTPELPVPSPITPVEPPPVSPTAPAVPPVSPIMPTTPPVPAPVTAPSTSPVPAPTMPTVPVLPAPDVLPAAPAPNVPVPPVTPPAPAAPFLPTPVPSESVPAKPDLKPAPAEARPPEALAMTGRFVVLHDNKLIEGAVSVAGDTIFVTQGAIKRKFPKSQVQFVGDSRDEVHRFMVAKVPATSAAGRLQVARWCMFNGMREQALAEAREVQKIRPAPGEGDRVQAAARDLARSLELSLQQYPVESAAKMTAPTAPTFPAELAPVRPAPPAVLDPEPDVSPEAALVFGARVQPFLANRCTECHAKPDHPGKFKLVNVNPTDAGPLATRTNLRAVAGQLRRDDPAASPLLTKSLSAHGGMKLPAIESRHAVVYQSLEMWTAFAVGAPLSVPPQVPAPPAAQSGDASLPILPAVPAHPTPVPPVADPLPVPPAPVVPAPGLPLPVAPPTPVIPLATDPVPPALPPGKPVPKPVPPIPPADAGSVPVPPIPPAPPAAPVPPAPGGATQFGATIPPKVPATGPAGGDEFDPAGFNQLPKK